jgi:hypothetical protein
MWSALVTGPHHSKIKIGISQTECYVATSVLLHMRWNCKSHQLNQKPTQTLHNNRLFNIFSHDIPKINQCKIHVCITTPNTVYSAIPFMRHFHLSIQECQQPMPDIWYQMCTLLLQLFKQCNYCPIVQPNSLKRINYINYTYSRYQS